MGDLNVELYGHHIGRLVGTDERTFDFATDDSAFEVFQLGDNTLSHTVPLVPKPNRTHGERRRNFFAELLPEGDTLEQLAARERLHHTDVIGLLRAYGRDVAGALQIYDPDVPGEPRTPHLEPATDRMIGEVLLSIQDAPLGNFGPGGKTSLAGVQNKIVLARTAEGWNFARDGHPSTHIVKPETRADGFGSETMIYDEEYGDRVAKRLGLIDYDVVLAAFGGVPALVIERYDRSQLSPDARVHQEDLNQALGVARAGKYQKYGGSMYLKRVAELLAGNTPAGSLQTLAKLLTTSVALGNLDLHGKNISLLHPYQGEMSLAPAYDVVPMVHQRNDHELAMAVNDVYLHAHVTASDIEEEVRSWSKRVDPRPIVRETLLDLEAVLREEQPDGRAYPALHDDVTRFTTNLLTGRPAGAEADPVIPFGGQ
ncbi:MAG: toxin HipA [Microbacterium sp.]|jgi:serine/threonine-protein kinase HipA|nr:toxin HipA [Microbacterium sp.]